MDLKKLYEEIDKHLLMDEKPSVFLEYLYKKHHLDIMPFTMLCALKKTEQSPKYHAEGNVWNHTMLVVDEAADVKKQAGNQRTFMWAALLHDIGKAVTTKYRKGRITAYGHDEAGARMVYEFFSYFEQAPKFIEEVAALVRWHMQILYVTKGLPFAKIEQMKRQVDIKEIALLGLCDRLGRLGVDRGQEKESIRLFMEKIKSPVK